MAEGKYGAMIKSARGSKPENQKTELPENQITSKPEASKKKESKPSTSSKPENQRTRKPEEVSEKMVNLCVKVSESKRRYWAAQSKMSGTTMTEIIIDALTQKLGLPENQ